ncbi:MAG: hypothetical protein ABSF60_14405 [Verrucomicrobiota bacterium]|jgi:hypothetical protein
MKLLLQRNVWFMFVVTIFVTACKSHPALTDTSSVESDIRAHLSIGSSKAQVDAYLNERKIRHSWLISGDQFPGNPSIDPNTGLPIPVCPTEEGIIDNAQTDYITGRVSIVIDLKFDATKSKLVGFSVQEVNPDL